MLRLPPFQYHRPTSLAGAVALLGEYGEEAMVVAGGTDLLPNMKHGLFTPSHLVALKGIPELKGIGETGVIQEVGGMKDRGGSQDRDGEGGGDGPGGWEAAPWLTIGAGETLHAVASHPIVRQILPALAEAAGHVAGPQLRAMGTLGGNLALETRCTYYNQTRFWRDALGYCLKKDGTVCHVTKVGKKCVAAHSADTPPVLMLLGAEVELTGPAGTRRVPVSDFFLPDGIRNTRRGPDEILVRIHIPRPRPGARVAYRKLRQRKAIDYPLLTVAVAVDIGEDGRMRGASGVVTALGSRPKELTGWGNLAAGEPFTDDVVEALAERAWEQCRPLDNITVDPEWRRAMVRVQVRRALLELRSGARA